MPRLLSKFFIFITVFCFSTWLWASSADAAWYNDGGTWLYRKTIIIDHTKVSGSGNFTDFPVLISLASDSDISSHAQSDADDIVFTSSNGTTKLDHEIERYVNGTGQLVAWVKVPSLDFDDNTTIYLYYGNGAASNQQNPSGVWSDNFEAVWHFPETSSSYLDSTSGNNDSTTVNVTTRGVASQIGTAADYALSNEVIFPDSDVLDISGDFTVEAWVNADAISSGANYNSIIFKGANPNYGLRLTDTDEAEVSYYNGSTLQTAKSTGSPLSTGAFYHLVGVFNDTADILTLYVNSSQAANNTGATGSPQPNGNDLTVGENVNNEQFDGIIDEVRISSTTRSTDWITTAYNNQDDPGTFFSLGTEQQDIAYTQSAYRWFTNANSTDVGAALAAQDNVPVISSTNTQFRLRLLIHVANQDLGTSTQNFKLQYAEKSGVCDSAFSGETYADVTTTSTIAYYNNASPADGAALTNNANDPSHSGHTIINQTYEEANNFTNSEGTIAAGEDGKWDFSLFDNGAKGDGSYCFRVVTSTSTNLNTYSAIPEITFLPSLTFSIAAVGANTVNNGITTSVASTTTTLPFGNLTFNTPKYIAQALSVTTNARTGYSVTMKINPTFEIQGIYPANNIDPFAATGVSWSAPMAWTSPTGTVKNVNSGWIGANTTDTRVSGWSSSPALKFGPVSTDANPVMQASGVDTGTTIYVTYGLEVNVFQPSDMYAGQIIYNVTANY